MQLVPSPPLSAPPASTAPSGRHSNAPPSRRPPRARPAPAHRLAPPCAPPSPYWRALLPAPPPRTDWLCPPLHPPPRRASAGGRAAMALLLQLLRRLLAHLGWPPGKVRGGGGRGRGGAPNGSGQPLTAELTAAPRSARLKVRGDPSAGGGDREAAVRSVARSLKLPGSVPRGNPGAGLRSRD